MNCQQKKICLRLRLKFKNKVLQSVEDILVKKCVLDASLYDEFVEWYYNDLSNYNSKLYKQTVETDEFSTPKLFTQDY